MNALQVHCKLLALNTESNQFVNEEVPSTYAYPAGYAPKGIGEQAAILRQAFPELGSCGEEFAKASLPADAEAFFAIPRWEKVAKTYNEAVEKVIAAIKQRRPLFYNCAGRVEQHLRRHTRTVAMLQKLAGQQPGHDILVVPAQLGLRHRGRSVRRARAVFSANEFGLGAFEFGCLLLTHPERLNVFECLQVDCAGDECQALEVHQVMRGEGFVHAPRWIFYHQWRVYTEGFEFHHHWFNTAREGSGSASGFVPE